MTFRMTTPDWHERIKAEVFRRRKLKYDPIPLDEAMEGEFIAGANFERAEIERLQDKLNMLSQLTSSQGIREMKNLDDIQALQTQADKLVEALIKDNPEWQTCEHEFEPNTTMGYFRCDKCGARPHIVEALAAYTAFKERGE